MKIALINGSPKFKNSASGLILEELKDFLKPDSNEIYEYCFSKPKITKKEINELIELDTLVFAFPLYVDGIPSHILSCLVELESFLKSSKGKNITVYSLVNCGFYEGNQNKLAIEMMENWCIKAGVKWGQGLGIGAGGMITGIKNVKIGHGPKKNLKKAFENISSNILKSTPEENIFITANFPRFLYKFSAEIGWRKSIKANGLKAKDLFLRK